MQKEKGLLKQLGIGRKEGEFVSIEKKISSRFAQTILICCIILGVVTSVLSYISSISAISETINNTSDVGAVAKVDEQSLLEQWLRFLCLKSEKQTPKSLPSVV